MSLDPVETNPDHYKVAFENDRVRVLEYADSPGDRTTAQQHHGENIGDTETHVLLVELKDSTAGSGVGGEIGPAS